MRLRYTLLREQAPPATLPAVYDRPPGEKVMTLDQQLLVIRRWVYCRCVPCRAPTAPCRCGKLQLKLAETKTDRQTYEIECRLFEGYVPRPLPPYQPPVRPKPPEEST